MLIFRYLTKEILITLIALTSILLLIFMSNDLVLYLNRAVSGEIPGMVLMKLMLLELPMLIGPLLPLGFYITLLIVYGRLYAESEMIVLQASGYGPNQLLKHSFCMAFIVMLVMVLITFFLTPLAAKQRNLLLNATGAQILIQTIAPGRFHEIANGSQVFYIETMNRAHDEAHNIFWASQNIKNNQVVWDILWAQEGFAKKDALTGEHYVLLRHGKEFQGLPGQSSYQVASFEQYQARLPHPSVVFKQDMRILTFQQLLPFFNQDIQKSVELQWRLSLILMVLPLTLLAVPLSRLDPRSGKYAKLVPAICIFFIYANLLFVTRSWLVNGRVPLWLGFWWLHGVIVLLGLALIFHNRRKI